MVCRMVSENRCRQMWGNAYEKEKGKEYGQKFFISSELVQNVAEYRYLGSVINEHVENKVMIHSRATAGTRTLCAWLRRCRISVGEVQKDLFVKLLEAMVESVLLYVAEVLKCCKQTDALEQVQFRAPRIFLKSGPPI